MDKHVGGMTSCPPKTSCFACPSLWRTNGDRLPRGRRSVAIVAFCVIASFSHAQNHILEYDVKAAYLFNFGKPVRFAPSDAVTKRQGFDFCILDDDPLGHTLDELTATEQLDGKPVRVVRLKSAAEATGCAIAYISASEGTHVRPDLDALRGQAVLTVSDASKFLPQGGMIQFVMVANHVGFAVNLDAVRIAQLSLSSELLKVAISVNDETATGVRR